MHCYLEGAQARLRWQRPVEAVASTSGRAGAAVRLVGSRPPVSRPTRVGVVALASGWSTSADCSGEADQPRAAGPLKAASLWRSKQRPRREPVAPDAHAVVAAFQMGEDCALRWPPSRARRVATTHGLRKGARVGSRRRNTSAAFILGKLLKGSAQAAAPDIKPAGAREPASPAESSTSASVVGAGLKPFPAGERVLDPKVHKRRIPIYVMLPLNTVTREGQLQNVKALAVGFQALKQIGVDGVMVDVWWGVVERIGPKEYDWAAYKQLMSMVKAAGLKLQATMSFHACGANVGDVYEIPLPSWVLEAALQDPDMLFTDQHGYRNPECLSLFADNAATVASRTPLQCYEDLLQDFVETFREDLGKDLVEVNIGCGPCGELRYPAYPENKRCLKASQWRFPGIGEFQCYDKRALLSLAKGASEAGHIEWGGAGPHDAGGYNDLPHETGFFKSHDGSWDSAYGQFFLSWYSGELVAHGDRVLTIATRVFAKTGVSLSLKCAGVHWWYNSRSHAAELTAGYYNTRAGDRSPERNGYAPIVALCAQHGVSLNFTCVEMRDIEHPWVARCGPEGLLKQIRATSHEYNVPVIGENALCRFDGEAYNRIISNCVGEGAWDAQSRFVVREAGLPPLAGFTFLRMSPALFDEHNFPSFVNFVRRIREAMGWKPDAEVEPPKTPTELPDPCEFVENCESIVACQYRLP